MPKLIIMKKYLISILFLLPCLTFAQKKSIDGFMDIPFGSDSATVKAAVFAKGGTKNERLSEKDDLMFSNFSMSARPVTSFFVKFVNNKAFEGTFYFNYSEDVILPSYDNLVTDLTAVYGKPAEVDNFDDLNNTAKIWKLKSGNIIIKTAWQSKNKNTIVLSISPVGQLLMIQLDYQDSDLYDLNAAKRRTDL